METVQITPTRKALASSHQRERTDTICKGTWAMKRDSNKVLQYLIEDAG